MTVDASIRGEGAVANTFPILFRMTVGAVDVAMPPGEGEIRGVVVEARRRLEAPIVVTACTILVELAVVDVLMAADAGLSRTQVCLPARLLHEGQNLRLLEVGGRMALTALDVPMGALEPPACLSVIEALGLPSGGRKVLPLVFEMAPCAALAKDLRVPVITPPNLPSSFDESVAIETLRGVELCPARVAVRAVLEPLEGLVSPRERPGRKHLGRCRPPGAQPQPENDAPNSAQRHNSHP